MSNEKNNEIFECLTDKAKVVIVDKNSSNDRAKKVIIDKKDFNESEKPNK